MGGELDKLVKVFPNPGTGTAYPPTALPTVGPYALPVPGFVPGSGSHGLFGRDGRRARHACEGIAANRRYIHCQPTPYPLPTDALSCQLPPYRVNRRPILGNTPRNGQKGAMGG